MLRTILLAILMLIVGLGFTALNLLGYFLWLVVFVWLVTILLTLFGLSQQRQLSSTTELRLKVDDAPLVSVLVPARNEADRVLMESISSVLAQDYGRFEVIAVNDRSIDATGAILKSLAAADNRLRVIEGPEPPRGWLGKPFAMQQALNLAQGEWILATDADMIFDPTALRTAVANALERKADALTFIPHFEAGSFWERVMIPAWAWVFLLYTIFYRIDNPKSPGAAAIGGFFLMRRAILERVGNYEALRDEVIEDVRLAEMIKRAGGTLIIKHAPSLIRTRMYRNFSEMWECCTKNWFAGMKFSFPLAMSAVLSMYLIAVVPALIAIVSGIGLATGAAALWRLFIPAALSSLMQVFVVFVMSIRSGVSPAYALTAPLGLGVLYAMLFDSSMRISLGKGVRWKGRRIYEAAGVSAPRLRGVSAGVSEIKK
jgi:chlorobactene glucosyltransferase